MFSTGKHYAWIGLVVSFSGLAQLSRLRETVMLKILDALMLKKAGLALMFALVLGACAPSGTGSVSVPVQPWYCYEARDGYCPLEPRELGTPYTLTP